SGFSPPAPSLKVSRRSVLSPGQSATHSPYPQIFYLCRAPHSGGIDLNQIKHPTKTIKKAVF
ncbi:MAG: hypothetical protein ACTH9E_03590, partial [Serratia proteamaculans]